MNFARYANPNPTYIEPERAHPGSAPRGERERVSRAIDKVYDSIYTVQFEKETPHQRFWRGQLHSPTGPIVWAEVDRRSGVVRVYRGGGQSATVVHEEAP